LDGNGRIGRPLIADCCQSLFPGDTMVALGRRAGQGCEDGARRGCDGHRPQPLDRQSWLMSSLGSWSFPRSRSAS
jgi:hypothetical protein